MSSSQEKFNAFIREKGLRLTSQRTVIARLALNRETHFTADDLLAWSREKDKGISRATVYRTLSLLTDLGLLESLDFGDGRLCYEPAEGRNHHDHIVCLHCGSITEFHCNEIEELQCDVADRLGFRVDHHSLRIYGTCKDCSERTECNEQR
ncbi:MAG: Fur family transcriptional regulator [bacterium]|nr:Fur family transcriptional regulator [bacterium]